MVLPLWSDTKINLEGDGGFSIRTAGRSHIFKPVSMQAMWSALQVLHKACEVSRRYNYVPGSTTFSWISFYESRISSKQSCVNEWNTMSNLETPRPESPVMFSDQLSKRERTESLIRTKLQSIMMFQDLENVTSKEILNELEQHVSWNQREYKEFIDNEMLLILSQIYKATLIFDYLYLGTEWDASNLEELRECGIGYILNMTREIDNFFPEFFCYYNVHVFDDESADLLAHWNETYDFIMRAKENNSKCLVHCKMGVSHSVSTVIAYAMKEYGWSLEKACNFVKKKRIIAQPSAAFMKKLADYEGILEASQQKLNKACQPCGDHNSLEHIPAVGASGARSPRISALMPEPEQCPWGHDARVSPCCWDEPSHHLNYNYYFRRLSDAALDSEPSTPVRCLPLLPTERVFIEVEDVERDALLEDNSLPVAQLVPLTEGTAAQTLEDMRLRLEFSTVEEEDEEEAQKEEAEMAALANKNCFGNENANNSNRLATKRSCPSSFDDSASSGKPHKVKPSYQSSMRLMNRRHAHCHNLPSHARISIQNPLACQYQSCGVCCCCPQCSCCVPTAPTMHTISLDSYCQCLNTPMSSEDLSRNLLCTLGPKVKDELQEMEEEEESPKLSMSTGSTAELSVLNLSLQRERSRIVGPDTQLQQ
ncbi:protein phosphatase Slingshot homolog 1 isoform X2 [Pangasianodon hypophthalmus]|nr:protein phosphatase Slingshot homolog 1 isoform X2 [Pangasianodon hypophthalmus]